MELDNIIQTKSIFFLMQWNLNTTKGQGTGKTFAVTRFCCIEVFSIHVHRVVAKKIVSRFEIFISRSPFFATPGMRAYPGATKLRVNL